MSSPLTDRLPLARHQVDRDYLTRDRADVVSELLASDDTRVLPLWRGRTLMASSDRLALLPARAVPQADDYVYLGLSQAVDEAEPVGTPLVAALLSDEQARTLEPDESAWGGLRAFGSVLSARDAGLAVEAVAVANWHDSHRFSPRSGALVSDKAGWVRRDPENGHEVFPRTDPAIIVAVTDADDRLLLGSNALWRTTATRCSRASSSRASRSSSACSGRSRGVRGQGRRPGLPGVAALAVPRQSHARVPRPGGRRRPGRARSPTAPRSSSSAGSAAPSWPPASTT